MRGIRATVVMAGIAGVLGVACDEPVALDRDPTAPDPQFHIGDEQPVRMTGGGRIDYPPGTAEKNTPESRTFQTFGFNVGDKDGDGTPEGNLQFVDHTPEDRLNGRPINLHSVSWSTFRRTVDACDDAGIEATGVLEVRNTDERHSFRMYACDEGEPGVGRDIFMLDVFFADGTKRWGWAGILTGGNLQAHFDRQGGSTTPTTGDLEVSTSTSGDDLDPDGYTVVVDGTQSQSIGVNAKATFTGLAPGDHNVVLTGVASNCTVGGSNPRTVSISAGMVATTTFSVSCAATGGTTATRIQGLGAIGPGTATPGSSRQDFEFDATDSPVGHLNYTDWGVVRPDGSPARVTVDPAADPSTAITSFTRSATDPACVTFGGTGRLDTGELVGFSIDACDNGSPGTGVDLFGISVPSHGYRRSGTLSSGEITLSSGGGSTTPTTGDLDVTASTTGSDLDPDGYTVVVDETQSQAIAVNGTVRFSGLAAGDHTVELRGVAANCTVSGSNPRAVTVTAGAVASTTFSVSCTATGGTVLTRITGLGAIGLGSATPGSSRQEFDFEATDPPGGRLFYTDYGVVRPDGRAATFTVNPTTDPETAITWFARSATDPTCVTFGGIGRVDTGDLAAFTIDACDRGSPGTGVDVFAISIPSRSYARGPERLSEGEITLTGSS